MDLHTATISGTGSGKTFLCMHRAREFRRVGAGTLILHKPREPWPADCTSWQTDSPPALPGHVLAGETLRLLHGTGGCRRGQIRPRLPPLLQHGPARRAPPLLHLAIRPASAPDHPHELHLAGALRHEPPRGGDLAEEFNDERLLRACELPPRVFFWKTSRYEPARLLTLAP
ncbi:MAG: hypothetical protein LBI02_02150 [Opitutaceae bacterium]|jgi:hypothetical protein|nr:hypothetical protein [Opitutaceae bacterium]